MVKMLQCLTGIWGVAIVCKGFGQLWMIMVSTLVVGLLVRAIGTMGGEHFKG